MSAAAPIPNLDREIATWQGRIAIAAKNGGGLDEYKAALNWVKQGVSPDNGLQEKAKQEILGTAERHLGTGRRTVVLEEIRFSVFPEDAMTEDALDALANDVDNTNEIRRLAKLGPLQYALERKSVADRFGIGVERPRATA